MAIAEELDGWSASSGGGFCVVLVRPRNPLNIGAAARALSNFGCFDLRLVEPYRVAAEEAKSAVGAGEVVAEAKEFGSVADAVADAGFVVGTTAIGHREMQHRLVRLDAAGELMRSRQANGERVALLFGSEKFGLSNDDLVHCHLLTRIPSRAEHGSMNLGQAVAVCLYEMARSNPGVLAGPQQEVRRARAGDVERISELLERALKISGYMEEGDRPREQKLRRMIRRMNLEENDAVVWQGMVRQILWKLEQQRA